MSNTTCPLFLEEKNDREVGCKRFIEGGTCTMPNRFLCTEYLKEEIQCSVSRKGRYTKCPRHFYLHDIEGWRSIKRDPMPEVGSMMHEIFQIHHAESDPGPDGWIADVVNSYMPSDEKERFPYYQAAGVAQAYVETEHTVSPVFGRGRTEVEINAELEGEGITLPGVVDYVSPDGKLIAEHKYTRSPGYYNHYSMQHQAGIYFIGLPDAEKMVLNLVQVPALKILCKGKPDEETHVDHMLRVLEAVRKQPNKYIHRTTYYRSEFDLQRVARHFRTVVNEIRKKCEETDMEEAFWENRNACAFPFDCEYKDVCEAGISPGDVVNMFMRRGERE